MAIENLTLLDSTNATVNMPVDSFGGQLFPLQQQVFGADGGTKTLVSTTDRLPVALPTEQQTANGAIAVGNATSKFRDNFLLSQPDSAIWDVAWTAQGTSSLTKGGDTLGSNYLRISMCPFNSTELLLTTKESFSLPSRFIYALSQSQRFLGQELEVSLVGVNDSNVVETGTALPSLAISGTVSVASNVATINFATAHSFKGGDRVIITGCLDPRINYTATPVTVVTSLQITVPLVVANGTYTVTGGVVTCINVGNNNSNSTGFVYESTTVNNGTFFSKRNNASVRQINATTATNTATQLSVNPFCDAFNMGNITEIIPTLQDVTFTSRIPDTLAAPAGLLRWSTVPDEQKNYKLRIRARNYDSMTRPIARITAISKSGSTTATVTTDVPHNLATSSFVQIQGVRDITNFPALVTTQVASIISSTQFTIVLGASVTASSAGGIVVLNQGGNAMTGLTALAVQSIVRTNNIMTITVNTTAAGALPGEFWHLYGCDATSMGLYDGAYKILRMNASTYEVESIGADFGSINCGGSFFKRSDHRIHNVQVLEYTRHIVEMFNQNGATTDISRSLPVAVSNTPAVTISSGTVSSSNTAIPLIVADIASAALTTTTTTAAVSPASGCSYVVNIPVTAVTGTTPTLDVTIQESDDTGTNWYNVYDFPRITATGMYRSPKLAFTGNRIRYVQTVGGTTPSFTRALNRLQCSDYAMYIRQLIDRSISLTTLNSTTPSLIVQNCLKLQLVVNVGAITTTAPALQVEGSDDNGTTWYSIGSPLTAVASSTVKATIVDVHTQLVRVRVSTAGVGVTAGYVLVKGF